MKQINLLPWREQEKKSKIRQFIIVWLGISCSCFSLLIIASIVVIQQIKNYQLISHHISLQLKTLSYKMQEINQLHYEKKELTKIIKIIQINHHQLKNISNFLTHLKYLVTPDIFINMIEFYPPYFILILHTSSEKNYLRIIKAIQIKFDYKLKLSIFNRSNNDSAVDFLIKMRV